MRYGTVCSGIEAPSVAWGPLGWEAQWFSEIEPFPCAVLEERYPGVPNLGDMTKVDWANAAEIELLIGGTPCQSFSVAGLRKGLDDPRGNLALEFLKIVDIKRPRWFVWENVPGVLSSGEGRDFGAFLGAVAELGYSCAYRVLDSQHFAVPQRRRRVFVVGYSGNWTRPAAALFERESLSGNTAKSGDKGQGDAALTASGVGTCGGNLPLVLASGQANAEVTVDLRTALNCNRDGAPIIAFHPRQDPIHGSIAPPCEAGGPMAVAYPIDLRNAIRNGAPGVGGTLGAAGDPAYALSAAQAHGVCSGADVRRLTPIECERLQGFPDNHTRIPWRGKPVEKCPDGHRYKALGNSMAVPVIRWIGQRIMEVEG